MENEQKKVLPIQTKRLLLREIEETDLYNVYKGLSNSQVIAYYGVNFDSLEATKEQMSWFQEAEQFWWAICSVDKQTFYGAAGLNGWSKEHNKAEIGLWLLPEFWGRGIMTEVMPLICDYGFNELGIHRIEGFVESDNLNCKKAMSKLDFEYEGRMKDCEVKKGKYISVDIYAKLNV
ncbi:MAG: GNAT family N-acetyltransferase [Flavobacteriales bacterium]|nr:GNAT family N-acetyltransferase [Flavobacteriales bacterium]